MKSYNEEWKEWRMKCNLITKINGFQFLNFNVNNRIL